MQRNAKGVLRYGSGNSWHFPKLRGMVVWIRTNMNWSSLINYLQVLNKPRILLCRQKQGYEVGTRVTVVLT